MIPGNVSNPRKKHSAREKDVSNVAKHISTSENTNPSMLLNRKNIKYIPMNTEKDTKKCPIAVSMNDVLYCICERKMMPAYLIHNFILSSLNYYFFKCLVYEQFSGPD